MKSANPPPPDAKGYKQSVPGGATGATPADSPIHPAAYTPAAYTPADYAEIAAIFNHQRHNDEYFAAHQEWLAANYPGQWVAVFQDEVVFAGASFRAVAEQVTAAGLPYNKAAVRRIAGEGQPV